MAVLSRTLLHGIVLNFAGNILILQDDTGYNFSEYSLLGDAAVTVFPESVGKCSVPLTEIAQCYKFKISILLQSSTPTNNIYGKPAATIS